MSYKRKPDGIYLSHTTGRLMQHNRYSTSIYWNQQMLSDIKRLFPITLNDELAGMLGVSKSTLVRKARELGLKKNKQWLADIWEERRLMANLVSMVKGYPGKFKKGHIPHNKKVLSCT